MFLPIINLLFTLFLLIKQGEDETNQYGGVPIRKKNKFRIFFWAIGILLFVYVFLAILGSFHSNSEPGPTASFKQEARNLAAEVSVVCVRDAVTEVKVDTKIFSRLSPNQYVNCEKFNSGTSTAILPSTTSNFDCDATISIEGVNFSGKDC